MAKQKTTTATIISPIGDDGLPSASSSSIVNPQSLRSLIVAPPGWGKTQMLSGNSEMLLLACEEGHKFVNCPKIVISSWDGTEDWQDDDGIQHLSFIAARKRIEQSDRFKMIGIDTLDALIKHCTDHFLFINKAASLKDLGDYGVGYDLGQNTPIRQELNRLLRSGRGMSYTTHQEIKQASFKNAKGEEKIRSKKETSLPNGVLKFIYPQVEMILHGEFGEVREGFTRRDRILRTEGSEEILAKNRGGVLPPAWIVPPDAIDAWNQFQGFFTDPETVQQAYDEYHNIYE